MSYLSTPQRLHFAGGFFSDPSTVNNDPAHYDNGAFDRAVHWLPQFVHRNPDGSVVIGPDGQPVVDMNGWWNPEGANRFRLKNVAVTSAIGRDGVALAAGSDPVLSLALISRDGPQTAKMVDLDPDQQLVSMIYGLRVALRNTAGQILMDGDVEPAPFSDIWRRGRGDVAGGPLIGNDERASVYYQTVVRVSQWGDLTSSPFLQQLQQAAGSLLSLKFQLDAYSMGSPDVDRLFSGRVVGTLGAATAEEPRHWQPGRHLAGGEFPFPSNMASPGFRPEANYGVAVVDRTRGKVRVDLGNALTVNVAAAAPPNSPVADQGRLFLSVVQQNGGETEISEIPYSTEVGWMERTAGIVEVPVDRALTAQELALVESRPLAVFSLRQGQRRRLLQEPPTHVRADMFVARMNAGDNVEIEFRASRLGQPAAGERVSLEHLILHEQYPVAGLTFPEEVVCDAAGKARVTLHAADPGKVRFFFSDDDGDGEADRRVHVDGQVYRVTYSVGGRPPWNPSDYLSVLVWNVFTPDEPPTWHGSLKPVFLQYGNLYPFMTTRGRGPTADPWIDMGDYEQVSDEEIRPKIIAVLRLAETHPHYMPVTRDLSVSRRTAMLRWLENLGADGKPLLGTPPAPANEALVAAAPRRSVAIAPTADVEQGSKTLAGERLMKLSSRLKSNKP